MEEFICKIKNCNKKITYNTVYYGKGMCHHHGNMRVDKKRYLCVDCNKELKYNAERCKECSLKWNIKERRWNWKGGKPYCIDCSKKVKNMYAKRCAICYKVWAIGENSPNYINGLTRENYPKEFNKQLKEFIRRRDNYICKICDITEEEHLIIYGYVLHIHHIDYDKQDNNENNLISLCIPCHVRTNYNRNYWKEHLKIKKEVIYNE